MSRDAFFRTANESEPPPRGEPPRCPRCHQAVDVRRYAGSSPPTVGIDCWRCHVTWEVEANGD